jgi:hypothetical protein
MPGMLPMSCCVDWLDEPDWFDEVDAEDVVGGACGFFAPDCCAFERTASNSTANRQMAPMEKRPKSFPDGSLELGFMGFALPHIIRS